MLKGLLFCLIGIGALILCGVCFAAWWGICWGSVILGIVLLLFAPQVLFLPLPIGIFGLSMIGVGMEEFTGNKKY